MKRKIKTPSLVGDNGKTFLFSGEELSKTSLRVEVLGDLDELNCVLGVARAQNTNESIKSKIFEVQQALFKIGSEIATTENSHDKLPQRIDSSFLETWIKRMDDYRESTAIPTSFVIPGDTLRAATIDHARAVSRRFERSLVALYEQGEIKNDLMLVWANRLSYYLFLLARAA